jgi:AcrR family transcriptional regulator
MSRAVNPRRTTKPKAPSKRTYRSALRLEQAQLTRRRVLDAAEELFLTNGFGATTMTALAERAGVATDTIYATLGSKLGVLKALMDVRVAGDDKPAPLLDRLQPTTAAETDPRRRVEMVATDIAAIHERSRRIDDLLLSAAGDSPEIAALRADIQQRQRLEGIRRAVSAIKGDDELRPGLDELQAADTLWALAGPDVHRLLRAQRGWDAEQYRDWLADSLQRLLLA